MYGIIRRYNLKTAQDKKAFDELKQRIDNKFVPMLHEVRGFHGYYAINVGNKQLVTITLCDDQAGCAESSRRAAEFVKTDPMKDQLTSPEILEGDLLISKEAAVGAR
jgi:hypothetical protein